MLEVYLQAVNSDKKFLSLVLRFSDRQITDFETEKTVIGVHLCASASWAHLEHFLKPLYKKEGSNMLDVRRVEDQRLCLSFFLSLRITYDPFSFYETYGKSSGLLRCSVPEVYRACLLLKFNLI